MRPALPTAAASPVPGLRLAAPWLRSTIALRWRGSSALLAAGVLVPLTLDGGGYAPTAWGWSALALACASAVAIAVGARRLSQPLEIALVGAFGALALLTLASRAWSTSPAQSVLEGERTLVYLAGVLAVLLVIRRATYRVFLAAVLAAVVVSCGYGLATRLFPERLATVYSVAPDRLAAPVGYWNGLGVLASIGILLALGLAARSRSVAGRAAAGASLLVLAPTLYFTFSRGGWVALGAGLCAALALDRRRAQFLVTVLALAPWPALGVWLAFSSPALARVYPPQADAPAQGHRLALALLCLAAVAGGAAVGVGALAERISVPVRARRASALALAVAVAVAATAVFVRYGSPAALAQRAVAAAKAPPPDLGTDPNRRLFVFSLSSRITAWRVAWHDYREHPWLGSGAGSFERSWLAERPNASKIRDAHSLYVETLTELGPAGLGLMAVVLGLPLFAAARARRRGLVPAAAGAYAAFLVHAAFDWDWELPAVTLTALLCGAAVLVAARPSAKPPPARGLRRAGALAGVLALAAAALFGLVGNTLLARASDEARSGRFGAAEAHARAASGWIPWSPDPWRRLGEAQLARGKPAAAQTSFRAAIRRDPRDSLLWLDLARATSGRARSRALAEAARLNPLSPELAELRAELGSESSIVVVAGGTAG